MATEPNGDRWTGASLEIHPLDRNRWDDFERLFGVHGACGGCWCMWWKLTHKGFERQKGEGNRKAMMSRVQSGESPGLLAYEEGTAIGWCAVEPRERFPRLNRSRILARIDELPVWSVVCFFVNRHHRGRGLTVQLLRAAIEHVRHQGGTMLEGYPVDPNSNRIPEVFAYHGLAAAFKRVGFEECLRRSKTRPIMRYRIG